MLQLLSGLLLALSAHAQVPREDQANPIIGGYTVHCADPLGAVVFTRWQSTGDMATSTIQGNERLILLSPSMLSLPSLMQLFIYAHECGHHFSGDVARLAYLRHDNLAREQVADRIGIRFLRDQIGLSQNEAQGIADQFMNMPARPPYYLPGPLRARWIMACYNTTNADDCEDSSVVYAKQHPGQHHAKSAPPPPMPVEIQTLSLAEVLDKAIDDAPYQFKHLKADEMVPGRWLSRIDTETKRCTVFRVQGDSATTFSCTETIAENPGLCDQIKALLQRHPAWVSTYDDAHCAYRGKDHQHKLIVSTEVKQGQYLTISVSGYAHPLPVDPALPGDAQSLLLRPGEPAPNPQQPHLLLPPPQPQ